MLADENGVRFLQSAGADAVVRAKVLGFRASGERHPLADDRKAAEAWRCRVLGTEVARTVRRGGLVRINIRAKDLKREARRHSRAGGGGRRTRDGRRPRHLPPDGGGTRRLRRGQIVVGVSRSRTLIVVFSGPSCSNSP